MLTCFPTCRWGCRKSRGNAHSNDRVMNLKEEEFGTGYNHEAITADIFGADIWSQAGHFTCSLVPVMRDSFGYAP